MHIIRLLARFVPPYKWKVVLNFLFNLLSTVFSLFSFATIIPALQLLFGISEAQAVYTPLTEGMALQEMVEAIKGNVYFEMQEMMDARGTGYVLVMLGLFLVVTAFLKCLTAWLANFYMVPIRTGVLRDLRTMLYNKVVSLPIGFFTEEKKGDVMSRMTNDVNEVEASIMSTLDIIFKDPLMIIVYLSTLFFLSWQLTVFVLVLLPVVGLLIGRIGRSLKRTSTIGQEQTADLLTQIEETLGGLRVVKAFNAEQKLRQRFAQAANQTRRTFNRINRRYYLAHPVSEFLGTVMIAVLIWYGGGLILSEDSSIDAATFIYYLVIFYSIINPFKDLSKASYGVRRGLASLERIDRILEAKSNITEPAQPLPLQTFEKEVRYEHVSFAYQADRPVLRDVSLTIPRGKMIALVGQSGSGKTTMADLLPRFYDVNAGRIMIDGKDLRDVRTFDLRALMGNVNQEAILFNDTFFNNITFGVDTSQPAPNGKTWQEAVEEAARIANAHEFIMATPAGYQTTIGDRGSRLSGGQRQRISIARAILKNPPILILDEATSALDTESEQLVQEALEHLMHDRTTLVVAHRLSTIRHADLICVLHEGQIVEQGKHDELLAMNGYYRKLVEMQNTK
ncbi:MAG: ABC transporter ATP-binding protein/permease [Paludibacteraceae bacterium]|nr:ABC transporter ATP-binding protein/permease [Paludibacteraceae bacterium]